MSTDSGGASELQRALTQSIRKHWGLFLIEGIVLVVLGLLAIIIPPIATIAVTIFLGWLFLISGIVGSQSALGARNWQQYRSNRGRMPVLSGLMLLLSSRDVCQKIINTLRWCRGRVGSSGRRDVGDERIARCTAYAFAKTIEESRGDANPKPDGIFGKDRLFAGVSAYICDQA
jgi:hypothetical protein